MHREDHHCSPQQCNNPHQHQHESPTLNSIPSLVHFLQRLTRRSRQGKCCSRWPTKQSPPSWLPPGEPPALPAQLLPLSRLVSQAGAVPQCVSCSACQAAWQAVSMAARQHVRQSAWPSAGLVVDRGRVWCWITTSCLKSALIGARHAAPTLSALRATHPMLAMPPQLLTFLGI